MDLKGIIAIAGKPGLYKVAAQGRNNIIVQSLENDKKFPAFASDKISALDDISIYTYQKDVPLTEVYLLLCEKENFKPSISHKEEPKKLREYLVTFLPDYDAERVYDTDVKKLFQWYNLLVEKGIITKEKVEEAKAAAKADAKPAAAAKASAAEADGDKPKAAAKAKPSAKADGEKAKPAAKAKADGEKAKPATKAKPAAKADGDKPKAAKKTK
ncbi:MAG: DUF5606 domain-containing protein [Crocinitomicaceae bacterium]|nr:DUF5606 domain-containing protein [Crocinitomicaceae bacterium]